MRSVLVSALPGWAWPLVGVAGMAAVVVLVALIGYVILTVKSNR